MSPRRGNALPEAERPTARLPVQTRRNLIIQITGLAMLVAIAAPVTPWPAMAVWLLAAVGVLASEDLMLRHAARQGTYAKFARRAAPVLRVLATCLYALAALTLISRGASIQRLFAFALMSVSMVHVLMRYYRSRWVLIASLSPYVAILGMVAVNQAKLEIRAGHTLEAVMASFTLLLFALQFWSARAQLAATWGDLMEARKAAEERERAAEAASRAKSNFLATMSHELRTPLNGVLGMVQALNTEQLTQLQRERVRVIRRSSENLLAVLNDLLDLSKIEASALELEVAEFDMEHLIRGVVAAYQPQAEKKGLDFAFEISPKAMGRYDGDSARIRRILYSLADNAVKFTEAGGVTLSVDREAGEIVFRVVDSGIGIAANDLTHLFEGFYQADSSRTRRYGGAGLGLAICSEMARLMRGSIEAESTPGQGSAFAVRLPLLVSARRSRGPAGEAPTCAGASSTELRVLVAEDNDTNQLVLKTLLSQVGVNPTIVENGRQVLDAWEDERWDIILMDIQMPIMDGVAATREIRARETETGRARTPILAVTANAMIHQVAEYEAAGMDGMAPKPIDFSALLQAMERALEPADALAPCDTAEAA